MLKFSVLKYGLTAMAQVGSTSAGGVRPGALLKVEWPNGNTGYADLFPWPEWGDDNIDDQLIDLAKGRMSRLVEQAIWLAKKDALLRKEKKNAFTGMAKIKNHFLVPDFTKFTDSTLKDMRSAGFTSMKVKVSDLEETAKFVSRTLKQNSLNMRLDFNAKATLEEYEKFLSYLGPLEKSRIEFVEDPIPWNLGDWAEAAKLGIALALDQDVEKVNWEKIQSPLPFKVVIIKPARTDVEKTMKFIDKFALKMVVTSSLDHSVGIAHACSVAADLKKFYPNTVLDCGCLSQRVYRPNEYSSRMLVQGPYLTAIQGTGIGFDELFERADWKPIEK